MEHSRYYGSRTDEELIRALVQKCPECSTFCGGGVVQLARDMEKHYMGVSSYICALCQNMYITKTALDCHVVHNHGGMDMARRDYEWKYKLSHT